jgi:Tfp pilus assembly protein FimV
MSSILELEYAHPASTRRHLTLVPPAAASPASEPHLRLTRRGRLTIFLGTVLALVVLAVVLGSTTVATDEPGAPVPATTVTVMPGQTLWDIASDANPAGQDIRTTVADIMRLNSMESAGELQAGSQIAVPRYR